MMFSVNKQYILAIKSICNMVNTSYKLTIVFVFYWYIAYVWFAIWRVPPENYLWCNLELLLLILVGTPVGQSRQPRWGRGRCYRAKKYVWSRSAFGQQQHTARGKGTVCGEFQRVLQTRLASCNLDLNGYESILLCTHFSSLDETHFIIIPRQCFAKES
jgi:hypothetical protein